MPTESIALLDHILRTGELEGYFGNRARLVLFALLSVSSHRPRGKAWWALLPSMTKLFSTSRLLRTLRRLSQYGTEMNTPGLSQKVADFTGECWLKAVEAV